MRSMFTNKSATVKKFFCRQLHKFFEAETGSIDDDDELPMATISDR